MICRFTIVLRPQMGGDFPRWVAAMDHRQSMAPLKSKSLAHCLLLPTCEVSYVIIQAPHPLHVQLDACRRATPLLQEIYDGLMSCFAVPLVVLNVITILVKLVFG